MVNLGHSLVIDEDGCLDRWQVRIFPLTGNDVSFHGIGCCEQLHMTSAYETQEAALSEAYDWVNESQDDMGAEQNVFLASSQNYMLW